MIDASDVAVVIPTRGNVDLERVLGHLPFIEIGVWDNSTGEDLSVYGRYAAIEKTEAPVILTLDDDVLLSTEAVAGLLAAYEPGILVANMPAEYRRAWYTEHCMVGMGAIFDRDLPAQAFRNWGALLCHADLADGDFTPMFNRTCDVVFTALTPRKLIDEPVTMLPYAYGADRMYRREGFHTERVRMLELALKVRDGVAA